MKVKELIEKLSDYDPEMEVVIWEYGNWTKITNLRKIVFEDYTIDLPRVDAESDKITVIELE